MTKDGGNEWGKLRSEREERRGEGETSCKEADEMNDSVV